MRIEGDNLLHRVAQANKEQERRYKEFIEKHVPIKSSTIAIGAPSLYDEIYRAEAWKNILLATMMQFVTPLLEKPSECFAVRFDRKQRLVLACAPLETDPQKINLVDDSTWYRFNWTYGVRFETFYYYVVEKKFKTVSNDELFALGCFDKDAPAHMKEIGMHKPIEHRLAFWRAGCYADWNEEDKMEWAQEQIARLINSFNSKQVQEERQREVEEEAYIARVQRKFR